MKQTARIWLPSQTNETVYNILETVKVNMYSHVHKNIHIFPNRITITTECQVQLQNFILLGLALNLQIEILTGTFFSIINISEVEGITSQISNNNGISTITYLDKFKQPITTFSLLHS